MTERERLITWIIIASIFIGTIAIISNLSSWASETNSKFYERQEKLSSNVDVKTSATQLDDMLVISVFAINKSNESISGNLQIFVNDKYIDTAIVELKPYQTRHAVINKFISDLKVTPPYIVTTAWN